MYVNLIAVEVLGTVELQVLFNFCKNNNIGYWKSNDQPWRIGTKIRPPIYRKLLFHKSDFVRILLSVSLSYEIISPFEFTHNRLMYKFGSHHAVQDMTWCSNYCWRYASHDGTTNH